MNYEHGESELEHCQRLLTETESACGVLRHQLADAKAEIERLRAAVPRDAEAEREHCERAAAEYLKRERLAPYDERWALACEYMRERAAARAETAAELARWQESAEETACSLDAAQAEIERLREAMAHTPSMRAQLMQAKAEVTASIEFSGHKRIADLQAKLMTLCAAAERACAKLREFGLPLIADRLAAAIEASR